MDTTGAKRRSKLRHLGNSFYNRTNNEVLGRTCTSWGQILAFYIVFYGVLALIFFIHLTVFVNLTPEPNVGTTPWNFGRYAYSNYPNRKIDLILVPSAFTFNRRTKVATLDTTDFNYISRILNSSIASGVNPLCLKEENRFGFDTDQFCLYLHIAKVFEWTPELISPALKDSEWLNFICTFQFTHNDKSLPLIPMPQALPLNLNKNNSKSFPFTNEPDYKIPVVGLFVNLTSLPEDFPSSTTGIIRCSLDFNALNMTVPTLQALNRLYEIPGNATATINFQS